MNNSRRVHDPRCNLWPYTAPSSVPSRTVVLRTVPSPPLPSVLCVFCRLHPNDWYPRLFLRSPTPSCRLLYCELVSYLPHSPGRVQLLIHASRTAYETPNPHPSPYRSLIFPRRLYTCVLACVLDAPGRLTLQESFHVWHVFLMCCPSTQAREEGHGLRATVPSCLRFNPTLSLRLDPALSATRTFPNYSPGLPCKAL